MVLELAVEIFHLRGVPVRNGLNRSTLLGHFAKGGGGGGGRRKNEWKRRKGKITGLLGEINLGWFEGNVLGELAAEKKVGEDLGRAGHCGVFFYNDARRTNNQPP